MKWLCAFKQKEPQNLPEAVKRQYRVPLQATDLRR